MRKISKIRSVRASLCQCQKILKFKGLAVKQSTHTQSKSPPNIPVLTRAVLLRSCSVFGGNQAPRRPHFAANIHLTLACHLTL